MKKNLLNHTLVIAALSALTITACNGKTAKESSTATPTKTAKESSSANLRDAEKESNNADSNETEKESSAPNPTESGATEGEKGKAENNSDSLVGSYNTNLVSFSLKDNPDAMNAFKAAFPKGYNYTHYEPIALLGTQVVSGTNYLYLCKSTWTDYQENVSFVLLQIYQDLSGKS